MRLRGSLSAALLGGAALCVSSPGGAFNRWVVFPEHPESLPAVRYANLDSEACLAELKRREVPFTSVQHPRIDTPIELTGELHGVRYEFAPRPVQRDVLDCRLGLALDDLSRLA